MSIAEVDSYQDLSLEARRKAAFYDGANAIAGRLHAEATVQIGKKVIFEDRVIKDLRQYHGRYEADIESRLTVEKKSRLFINQTRAKTHAWEARLSDMLFPTDADNWGIRPTPVPELMGAQELISADSDDAQKLLELQALANAKAKAMRAEIRDQFIESSYSIKARGVIHDGVKMGTGIMKGPIVENRTRRKYEQVTDTDDFGEARIDEFGANVRVWRLSEVADHRPAWERVDFFNYFPDMSARYVEEAEFHYQRHLMTNKQLRKLARKAGFDKAAIKEVMEGGRPQEATPDYLSKLREVTDGDQSSLGEKYHVWEYHGPLTPEEIKLIAMTQRSGQEQSELLESMERANPFDDQDAVVWFCGNRVLKYSPPLLETGDSIYSIFKFEKDETSIFGFGVPYLMRDSQSAMNAAWRMTMDNAGLSVGPQIVVDKTLIEPANGKWELEPKKVWNKIKNLPYATTAFEVHHIDGRQQQMAQIIEMAKQFSDDETNMPMIAQGERGAGSRDTAQGMSMLMNSVNVVFRRVVKTWDDDITVPNVRRSYDWNMAFSPKEFIKGDFETHATGSSVLLVRELQATNLMAMALQFSNHPVLGPITKVPALYRKLVEAHMLPPDELVMTDNEIDADAKAKAGEEPPPDIEMEKLTAQLNIVEANNTHAMQLAQMNQETALIQMAEKRDMTVEQLKTKILVAREGNQSGERKLSAEIAMADRQPDKPTGGSV
jgi:hypothetical protein